MMKTVKMHWLVTVMMIVRIQIQVQVYLSCVSIERIYKDNEICFAQSILSLRTAISATITVQDKNIKCMK